MVKTTNNMWKEVEFTNFLILFYGYGIKCNWGFYSSYFFKKRMWLIFCVSEKKYSISDMKK